MSEIRPQFFLVRENDTIVPLIALDELPADITIPGVSRNLGMADTGGMTSVGKVTSRGAVYVVNGVPEAKEDRFPAFNGKGKGRFGDKKQTGVPVDSNGRKIYCSFWLRHGECMFEQQGCQYKHIMPRDLDTIRRCGLHDIPPWYQKQFGVSSLLRPSGINQNNWRKPRGAWKTTEHNDETVKGNGATAHGKDNRVTATPESSNVEETVTGALVAAAEASHGADLAADKKKQPVVASTSKNGGTNPVTPPNGNRFVDFERVGTASFAYKYDAPAPQTPTERLPMRARRLFEARGPNNDYSTSPDSIPSMTLTGNSFSSFSSLGGTPRSASDQTVKVVQANKPTAVIDGDINAADDTLDNLNDELAKFTANEPPYRSISELLPTSLPEDRHGNLILI